MPSTHTLPAPLSLEGIERTVHPAAKGIHRQQPRQLSLSGELADVAGCPVDLLDLRAASTVMQYQVITQGVRWWARDAQAAIFESAVLSDKTELDAARTGLLADIQQRGSVYGG